MWRTTFNVLQKIGKSLMLPVSVLPAAGILLGVGSAKFAVLPPAVSDVMARSGGAIFGNLPIIFAVSVALGLTAGEGAAALAGVVGFAVLVATMGVMAPFVGYEPKMIIGMPSIETGVFGGLVIGAVVGFLYQRYSRTQLPSWLGFFSGSRLIPILTAFAAVFTGIAMAFVWPPVGRLIETFSHWAATGSPATAFGLYGLVERGLIPFGLHHIWNAPFFFEVGSYVDPATGNTIRGEIYRFTAGDPTAGNLAGGYLFKMWGLPAAALAMWQTARPENRAKVGGIMISAAMTSFLTGITEPIEFSFLFVAPLLYVIHAFLAGAAYVLAVVLGIHHSTTFSHGLIDFVVLYPNAQRGWWLLWLGPLYALLYYVIFRSVIVARDFKTPGRDIEAASTERAAGEAASGSMGQRLLAAFGGAGNIKSLDACITRLRIELHDPAKASEASLRELGATGVLKTAGGVQAIFGTRSEQLKHEMAAAMQGSASAPSDAALVAALGGRANITSADAVAHTRLRVALADASRVDESALAALGARAVQRLDGNIVHIIVGPAAPAWAKRLVSALLVLVALVWTSRPLDAQTLYTSDAFSVTATEVRQGPFRATAVGREQIVSTYPRAAREVHFKFALNGRDNEFPPGIEHTINLRPQRGLVATPQYTFGTPPTTALPVPVAAPQSAGARARVTIRLDLRAAKSAIQQNGFYVTPRGDTLRRLERVTVIGDTEPLAWDINQVPVGTPRDLTDRDGDGIYETTLQFATEFLRPVDRSGRASWLPTAPASGPTLTSPQPLLDALYRLSLDELQQLRRPDGALAAGAKWPGVWTRDVALATVLGLPFVAPDQVKASLRAKVDANGRIIQDTGTGGSWPVSTDRLTWALAAWELYAVTGDRAWLAESYAIIERSVIADRHAAWDPQTGLVRGESSFLDWREQSYPRWMQPADIATAFALGTNAVHLGARQVLARMATALGLPSTRAAAWNAEADTIRAGMRRWLWDANAQRHAPFRAGRLASAPSDRFEALGEAMAMLTGATPREARQGVLERAPLMPFGVPTIYPFIPDVPNYHNGSVWPFVGAYWLWAGAEAGHTATVEHGIATLTRASALFLTNKENFVAATGHFEGTALNSDRQLWSVAGQLAVQYRVLFGMRAEADRLAFRPMVPAAYAGERRLEGLRYRAAEVTVVVRGFGDGVARVTLNGRPVAYAEIPADAQGAQRLEIELNGRWPTDRVSIVAAATAPDTPGPVRVSSRGEDRVVLEWAPVAGAANYRVFRDGRPEEYPAPTAQLRVRTTDAAEEVQIVAVAANGAASFPSEPVRLAPPTAELRVPVSAASQRLRADQAAALRLSVTVPQAGRYAIDARYANGNGPINTEDKAAIRSLLVDGAAAGVLVMPQRGAGNWQEFGWSTNAIVALEAGTHELALAYTEADRNMNGQVNEAVVAELRLTRLTPTRPPPPRVVKAEPPEWWVGHSVNPVRVLLRGSDLHGARFACAPLRCSNVRVSDAGTYVFVDVEIPSGDATSLVGNHTLALLTAGGRSDVAFTVHEPLARSGRFAGVGADDLIYFVMPDRFADGDTTNNDPRRSRGLYDRRDAKAYHGGDLEGLRQRLPYLRSLGVTAIWMTPLYDNVDSVAHRPRLQETGRPYTDYHGYGATDLYAVEEHLGDLASLRRLVDDAHAAGIKIILDQVANHTGPEHVWAADQPTPTWYNGTLARHLPNNWKMESLTDATASPAVQDSTIRGWFADILPDFNQDDPEVERYLIQNTLWWIGVSGADAVRQDTWPYVHRRFWRPWMAALKREYPQLTVVGELWSEDPATVAFFEGEHVAADGIRTGVDQLFDFPLQAAARRVFAAGQPIRQLAQVLAQDRLYRHPERLVTFLENHDMPRLLWDNTATLDGILLGYTFLYTVRGIPKLYYGNEIAMNGGGDPDNRRDFPGGFPGDTRDAFTPQGRTADEQRVFTHLQALAALRQSRPDLRQARMEHLLVEEQQFVFRRGQTVVALNNARQAVTLRVPGLRLDAAAALGSCARARLEGNVTVIELPARAGCVF